MYDTSLDALKEAYHINYRVRLWYGDTETGEAWDEENDVMGYVKKSTGKTPIFILVPYRNSHGGGGILTDCIVRMDVADLEEPGTYWKLYQGATNYWKLYQHPKFDPGAWYVGKDGRKWAAYKNGMNLVARFETQDKADRYVGFMTGRRYAK